MLKQVLSTLLALLLMLFIFAACDEKDNDNSSNVDNGNNNNINQNINNPNEEDNEENNEDNINQNDANNDNENIGVDVNDNDENITENIRLLSDKPVSSMIPSSSRVSIEGSKITDENLLKVLVDDDLTSQIEIEPDLDSQNIIVSIDLRRIRYVDRIEIHEGENSNEVDIEKIEISNERKNYTTVSNGDNISYKDGVSIFNFSAQSAKYIKIYISNLNGSLNLSEIKAFFDQYTNFGEIEAKEDTVYYISDSTGDDSNDGLSEETAWKTLTKASEFKYAKGTSILLKAGDTFKNQTLRLNGSGTKDNPIFISTYSQADKAIIEPGMGQAHGIIIFNGSNYKITDIIFQKGVSGILSITDNENTVSGLEIANCEFYENSGNSIGQNLIMPYPEMYFGAGICMVSYGNKETVDRPYYKDIHIYDCKFDDNDTGVLNTLNDLPLDLEGRPTETHTFFNTKSYENVVLERLDIQRSRRSGGIMLYGCYDGVIDDTYITETGYKYGMWWGVAGCQLSMCEDFVVKNSEFSYTRRVNNSPDGEGFDFESGNINVSLIDSYVHNNEGPSILFYGQNLGWKGENTGLLVDGCILEDNGIYNTNDHSKAIKNYPDNEGVIKNTKIHLNFEAQGYDSSPLEFYDNQIFKPNGEEYKGKTDLTKDADIKVSSTYEYSNFSLEYINDGERSGNYLNNSGWSSEPANESSQENILVEFDEIKEIEYVKLYATQKWVDWFTPGVGKLFPKKFSIHVSQNGDDYTKIYEGSDISFRDKPYILIEFEKTEAKYVKIDIEETKRNPINSKYSAQIAEIEIE